MSQKVTKDVKSKGTVIAQVDIEVFDNLDEAQEALGDEECTSLINRQRSIELMDAKRREVAGPAGGLGLRAIAAKLRENPDLLEKVKGILGEG